MLRTDYKEDVFDGNRKYNLINNSDGTVSLIDVTEYSQEGDSFGASDINAVTRVLNNSAVYEKAGGTETVITLSNIQFEDGYSKTFIVTEDNGGMPTTINNKPLYKPGTQTTPILKKNKAVTVWYDLAGDCFFIKASASGTALAEHVLAPYTISNDHDTDIVGTIPSKGAQVYKPSTTDQIIAAGQYLSGDQMIKGDENLIPSKIPEDLTLFGVQGTRSLGKKFATGTVTSGDTSVLFAVPRGDAPDKTTGGYPITVSGLTFRPSVIVAIYSDPFIYGGRYVTVYLKSSVWKYTPETAIFGYIQYDGNGSLFLGIRANVSPAYVNSTGFSLPTGYPGKTYTWYAWE